MASDWTSQLEREEPLPYDDHLIGQLSPADVQKLKGAVSTAK